MDGARILASATRPGELDGLLVARGEDPEKVVLEFIDFEDGYFSGPESV